MSLCAWGPEELRDRGVRAVAAVLAALAGVQHRAGRAPTARRRRAGPVRVVAAENFWGSIAAQLGGDARRRSTSIIDNPDADPHDYEPTAGRRAGDRRRADLVIVNGIGYDPWATQAGRRQPGRRPDRSSTSATLVGVTDGDNPHRWYYPADVAAWSSTGSRADYERIDPADAAYFDARRSRRSRRPPWRRTTS